MASRRRESRKKSCSRPKVQRSFPSIRLRSCPSPMPTDKTQGLSSPRKRGSTSSIGWIGAGRMGYEMAGRLAKDGADILVWNRTKEKAKPLEKYGAKVADQIAELAARDIVFCMVATHKDVMEVVTKLLAGKAKPKMLIE